MVSCAGLAVDDVVAGGAGDAVAWLALNFSKSAVKVGFAGHSSGSGAEIGRVDGAMQRGVIAGIDDECPCRCPSKPDNCRPSHSSHPE
jgi:hypothetical protein